MTTKLLLPFITYLLILTLKFFNWITDVDSAISISNKENKPMLLIFTDANSSKSPLFAQIFYIRFFAIWARDNVVAVKLDLTDDESMDL
jgi:protein disulfide-isomerase